MRFDQLARVLTSLAVVAIVSVAITACGGGGNNGGGGTSADAVVMGISIPGVAGGNNFVRADGTSTLVPNVFLNGRLVITLGGPVDPTSLPPAGPAIAGPVEIVSLTTNTPARGVFSVNPANPNEVVFDAFPPTSVIPGQGCIAGFNGSETYRISVTAAGAGGGGNVLVVNGDPLVMGAAGTFSTIVCDPMNPSPAFTDSNGVDPQVVGQVPAPGSTMLVAQMAGFPTNSIITIDVDESVDPSSVNASNLVLVNKTINATMDAPVGGAVSLQQFGSVPGNPGIARITYATSTPLADGHTYEFVFLGVSDLAGKLLAAPATGTAFSVTDEMNNAPTTFFDDFSTTTNRGTTSLSVVWPGSDGSANAGRVAAIFPEAIVGNGLDGVGAFTMNLTFNADNQITPGDPGARPAVYNFTTLNFGAPGGAPRTINFASTTDTPPGLANFPIHFRAQGDLVVENQCTLNFDGRRQTQQGGTGANATTTSINGGWGGPGGGRGGTSSPINDPTMVNPSGVAGEGAHTDATDPTRPGGQLNNIGDMASPPTGTVDAFYGGGAPGLQGLNLVQAPNNGPSGGGGGNATAFAGYGGNPPAMNANITFAPATAGETQSGSDGAGTGAPLAGVAGQPMAVMMTPLTFAAGGSGGGASGDRGNAAAPNPAPTYRAGGAGGGAGGGVHFSNGGNMSFGILSNISLKGGQGGSAVPPFVAHGGGGSGGSFLAQTFGTLTPMAAATFDASGGAAGVAMPLVGTEPPLNGEGGRGGDGVIQLEDGNGAFITGGLGFITVRGELFTRVFPSAGTITDVATTVAIDTGSNGTDYTSASATSTVGTNATSTISVQIIGVAEDPNGPGQPATTAMSVNGTPLMVGPVSLANVDQLDGYRFFIVQITTSYPSPPAVSGADVLPFADDITVNYSN